MSLYILVATLLSAAVAYFISSFAIEGFVRQEKATFVEREGLRKEQALAFARKLLEDQDNSDSKAAMLFLAAMYPEEPSLASMYSSMSSGREGFDEWSRILESIKIGQSLSSEELKKSIAAARRDIGDLKLAKVVAEKPKTISDVSSEESIPRIAPDTLAPSPSGLSEASEKEGTVAVVDSASPEDAAIGVLPIETPGPDRKDLALKAIESGDYSAALEWLDAAITERPGDAELHYMYAYALFKGKPQAVDEALTRCERALSLDPGLRGAEELCIRLLEVKGDYGSAAERQRAFMGKYPDAATLESYAKTAALYVAAGKPSDALAFIDEAATKRPPSIDLCILAAQTQVAAGNVEAALARIAAFLDSAKDDGRLARYSAEASRKGGSLSRFLSPLSRIHSRTLSWEVAFEAGRSAAAGADYGEAEAWYTTSFEGNPRKTAGEKSSAAKALAEIARLKIRSRDYSAAASLCAKAVGYDDSCGQAYLSWSDASFGSGKADEGMGYLAKAADRGSFTAEGLGKLVEYYEGRDDEERAAKYVKMLETMKTTGSVP